MPPTLRLIKPLVLFGVIVLAALLGIAFIRTLTIVAVVPKDVCNETDSDFIPDSTGLSRRLAQALTFQSISWSQNHTDVKEVKRFIEFITKSFPAIHSADFVHREIVNDASLVYTVKGLNPSLKPYMLAGHLDVVPVDLSQWTVPPFGGVIKDGYIYGRGAIDAKHIVMGILEAFETAVRSGYRPQRSFYIAFGHDEEVTGHQGAAYIAKLLKSRNIDFEYILDEGLIPTLGCYPGMTVPVVAVGVTEKGYLSVNLTVKGITGHSSMPPTDSAIVTLSKILTKFHHQVHRNMFGYGLEQDAFELLAPYAPFYYRFIFANLWLFSPFMAWSMAAKAVSNALIRTTTAVTMVHGGLKDNVLPTSASAVINHRVHPAQTIEEVLEFDRQLINDENAKLEVKAFSNPAPISPYDSDTFGYQMIVKTSGQIYPNSPVIPGILMGNTDTRWYLPFSKAIYRFSPGVLQCEDTKGFHGNNERIPVKSYEKMVNFYYHLIKNSDAKNLQKALGHDEL